MTGSAAQGSAARGSAADEVAAALGRAVAVDHARITAAVIAVVGDWQAAEDAVQDACERALGTWGRDGIPANPAGWLVTTARRRGIDALRRSGTRESTARRFAEEAERSIATADSDGGADQIGDDRLRLVLTCVHPALALEARVTLTLRTVLGWTPAQIARAFLTSEAAVSKRLVRARAKIAHAGIPYRVPAPEDLPARIDGVLAVVYLVFTTGYADRERQDLIPEAVRLARLVRDLLDPSGPERFEATGLLALLLVQGSRQRARTDADGRPVPMQEQDRAAWDHAAIAEAEELLGEVTQRAAHDRRPVGRYTLQAAIAVEHGRACEAGGPDWARLASLHALLNRLDDVPAQRLAWAVAAGRAHGPARGLEVLDGLVDGRELHLFHAVRADLLEASGRTRAAQAAYTRAAELAPDGAERDAFLARAGELDGLSEPV